MTPTSSPPMRPAAARLRRGRRRLLALLAATPMLAMPAWAQAGCPDAQPWQDWERFVRHFVQDSGRVLDASTPEQRSSSESQSYGMFFALVANDPAMFEKMWRWSVDNLARGDIGQVLPAWQWGADGQGNWRVLDDNPASDGDLWFAYSLLEAGRLWQRPDYVQDARHLLANVQAREVAQLPGLGKMLLPGVIGFADPQAGRWRLNPSYLPLFQLRRLALEQPQGPWSEIAANTVRMIQALGAPQGFVPDWVAYQADFAGTGGQFVADEDKGDLGSYDAIRTYLWAGMTAPQDPASQALRRPLAGMAREIARSGAPPESVRAAGGQAQGTGPYGFGAALLPYLAWQGEPEQARQLRARVQTQWLSANEAALAAGRQPSYYDTMLSLFGTGWHDKRYRFSDTGHLRVQWEKTCPLAATP
ncbi:cellulose synthase complex periplasmic endoglucanase BcsZ [Orrella sp. JC864]|uniref:cellulose synthase complex periplasmic endoglucanase BcsZ n=1 Tax=Orrella sp. JC864 TaxID=3120298 RepID=UPI00300BF81B